MISVGRTVTHKAAAIHAVPNELSAKANSALAIKRGKLVCASSCKTSNRCQRYGERIFTAEASFVREMTRLADDGGRSGLQPSESLFYEEISSGGVPTEARRSGEFAEFASDSLDIYDRVLRSSPSFASGSLGFPLVSSVLTAQPPLDTNHSVLDTNHSVLVLEGLLSKCCDPVDMVNANPLYIMEPPTAHKDPGESSFDDNYYANVGDAIRTLRRELPTLFYKELTYGIYREDVVFRDPRNTFYGIKNYKRIFKTLRFFGSIFFQKHSLRLDILRIWQPCEGQIKVRWCIRGLPIIPWATEGTFDGTSKFKLDRVGKIYEHKVDNVIMNTDAYQPVLSLLNMTLARNQTPTPSYFSSPAALAAIREKLYEAIQATEKRDVSLNGP